MAGQRAVRTPASLGAHTVTVHTWNTHRAGLRRVQCGHPRMPIHNGVQGWQKHHCRREHRTEMIPGLKHTYHRPQTPIHRVIRMLTNTQNSLLCCQGENTFTGLIFFSLIGGSIGKPEGSVCWRQNLSKKKKRLLISYLFPPPILCFYREMNKGYNDQTKHKMIKFFYMKEALLGTG